MIWKYKSPIGDIFIKSLSDGSYGMIYNDMVWESCNSPQAEAANVYMHCTGCYEWDRLDGKVPDVPNDLTGWEIIK